MPIPTFRARDARPTQGTEVVKAHPAPQRFASDSGPGPSGYQRRCSRCEAKGPLLGFPLSAAKVKCSKFCGQLLPHLLAHSRQQLEKSFVAQLRPIACALSSPTLYSQGSRQRLTMTAFSLHKIQFWEGQKTGLGFTSAVVYFREGLLKLKHSRYKLDGWLRWTSTVRSLSCRWWSR